MNAMEANFMELAMTGQTLMTMNTRTVWMIIGFVTWMMNANHIGGKTRPAIVWTAIFHHSPAKHGLELSAYKKVKETHGNAWTGMIIHTTAKCMI